MRIQKQIHPRIGDTMEGRETAQQSGHNGR
jgi:hypothetical protein